jgi:hypothetical protein
VAARGALEVPHLMIGGLQCRCHLAGVPGLHPIVVDGGGDQNGPIAPVRKPEVVCYESTVRS